MSENVEKWRNDFEEWFTGGGDKNILKKDGAGNYTYMPAYSSWKSWLAAKQNQPVVELPKKYIDGCVYDVDQIHEALTAAGTPYKIKGE